MGSEARQLSAGRRVLGALTNGTFKISTPVILGSILQLPVQYTTY